MNLRIIISLVLIVSFVTARGQDPIFSQPYTAAQFLSPASVGAGGYGSRVQSNFRSQLIDGNSLYRTIAVGWDTRFQNEYADNINYLGVGGQIISDQVMGGIMQTNYISANVAYHIFIDELSNKNFSLGMGLTFAQISLDKSKLRFGDQFDYAAMYTGNSTLESLKPFPSKFSVNAGVLYSAHNEKMFFQVGANAFYYSKPDFTEFSFNQTSGLRATSFINIEKSISESYSIALHGAFSNRNNNNQFYAGGFIGIPIVYQWDEIRRLYLGCFYRGGDAIIPSMSFLMNTYRLGFSYDIYNNTLSSASIRQSSFEITLSKSFGTKRNEFFRTIFD